MSLDDQHDIARPPLRVAVVDDAFAPPTHDSIAPDHLNEFCSFVEEHDFSEILSEAVGSEFLDPALVTDEELCSLYQQRTTFAEFAGELDTLFAEFDRRRGDLDRIVDGIEHFPDVEVLTYSSATEMQDCPPVHVVFLDYYLKGGPAESREIARKVCESHRAFLVLMSDHTDAASDEETFRKRTKLLRGFYRYVPKAELVDPDVVYRTLLFVPDDVDVCRVIHDLVDALELTLGEDVEEIERGEIEDPPQAGQAVGRFMNVIRTLPLQDYAILCELTLSDEGHPLGDYVRRLFGAHLVEQVFTTSTVAESLKKLDKLRFTEFLPLADTPSDSLKELYAASLVEPITNPWGEHPWEGKDVPEQDADE